MVLNRVDEFETRGRRFSVYEGGSFVLFEELEDGAEGLGTVERSGADYVVTAWWKPGFTARASTLQEAIDELVDISADRSV